VLPGFSGSLVSEYYAERFLSEAFAGELGETSRDAARVRLLRWSRGPSRRLGPVNGARSVYDLAAVPLTDALGFEPVILQAARDDSFVIARLGHTSAAPALLVTAWAAPLDAAWRAAVRGIVETGAAWCLTTNGCQLRLVDARLAFARRFLELDLGCALDDRASFAVLWGLFRRHVFEPPPLVERVVDAAARHAAGVGRSLRHGVFEAMGELLSALAGTGVHRSKARATDVEAIHQQALTIVYRILFLLFAESRGLVPVWHPIYRDSYSMQSLLELAERPGRPRGLWAALQAISRLAHSGCRAGTLRVTAFNGRLFAPSVTPLAERSQLDDETARRVLLALSTTPAAGGSGGGGGRMRIAYRDLGVEQLGAVYESILDYRPQLAPSQPHTGARARSACATTTHGRAAHGTVQLVAGRAARKATGTFYTPRPITTHLVERTLAPLVSRASPDEVLSLRVVDPAMGSGAFLVAACRYLAGAYESAVIAAGGCHPSDISDDDRRGFRRLVAQQCLFGVDRNPMAVQLARLSLWLCTLAPDRPLTFLDHHLVVGDSLVGASIADLRRRPPGNASHGRSSRHDAPRLPLFGDEQVGPAIRNVLPAWNRLSSTPDETLAVVREKERLLAVVSGPASPVSAWRAAADLWCGFAFRDGDREAHARLFPAVADLAIAGRSDLPNGVAERWLSESRAIAAERRFFHWTLEFPDVFYAADGTPSQRAGFDAVIGNPPWDMIRGDGDDGAGGAHARSEAQRLLGFARSSGIYRAQGDGHANLFQLFVERACQLARQGGRIGLVVPWGLAADQGCAPLRRLLFDQCRVDAFIGFDNASAVFPIHRGLRFLLMTASTGGRTEALACRLGIRDPDLLGPAIDERHDSATTGWVVMTRQFLDRLSPGDLAVPDARTAADLSLLEKTAAIALPLGSADGWGAEFGRELNAADDRRHFERGIDGLPVLEGKHLDPFRVAAPADGLRLRVACAERLLDGPRTWGRARLAYRDVASATNRLTLIAAVVPPGCVTVHTLFCLKTALSSIDQDFLCGVLNSFVANYLVRLRVTMHVTTHVIARLPVPRPAPTSAAYVTISSLAARLRHSPAPQQDPAYAELQAVVAHLYQLTGDELAHVLTTFPLVDAATREGTMRRF
jgi:hypothetical protein